MHKAAAIILALLTGYDFLLHFIFHVGSKTPQQFKREGLVFWPDVGGGYDAFWSFYWFTGFVCACILVHALFKRHSSPNRARS